MSSGSSSSSSDRFALTPMILKNLRRFRVISSQNLHDVVNSFREDPETGTETEKEEDKRKETGTEREKGDGKRKETEKERGDSGGGKEESVSGAGADLLLLIRLGADVNAVERVLNESPADWEGEGEPAEGFHKATALHLAARRGAVRLVLMLMSAGAHVEVACRHGYYRPLHVAAMSGKAGVIDALVKGGAQLEALETKGVTALTLASRNGRVEAIRRLLKGGANVNAGFQGTIDCDEETTTNVQPTPSADGPEGISVGGGTEEKKKQMEAYGCFPITQAALGGHAGALRVLLEAGASADARDSTGAPAICIAAERGHAGALETLLDFGRADLKKRSYRKTRMNALTLAAFEGDVRIVKLLVDRGMDVDIACKLGKTALIYASTCESQQRDEPNKEKGTTDTAGEGEGEEDPKVLPSRGSPAAFEEVARILLDAGAKVNHADHDGHTALISAAKRGLEGFVRLLLESGGKEGVNLETKFFGETALIVASLNGHIGVARLLLEAGGNPNVRLKRQTHHPNMRPLIEMTIEKGHVEIALLLLEGGAEVSGGPDQFAKDGSGARCLIASLNSEHWELARKLLEKGANPNAEDVWSGPALALACEKEEVTVVRALVDAGANVQVLVPSDELDENTEKEEEGEGKGDGKESGDKKEGVNRFVARACRTGAVEILKVLIEAGADVKGKDKSGAGALTVAVMNDKAECVRLLLEAGAETEGREKRRGWTLLMLGSQRGQADSVRALLKGGADVNATDKGGKTALLWAAEKGHQEAAGVLLEGGAAVDAVDKTGCTAMNLSTRNGHAEVVKTLLDAGGDFEKADKKGVKPLLAACVWGYGEIVKPLLERGADPNAADAEGKSALMGAAECGHAEVLDRLVEGGSEVDAVDSNGETALIRVLKGDHYSSDIIARALLERGAGVNVRDRHGTPVLELAFQKGKLGVVSLLVEKGAEGGAEAIERLAAARAQTQPSIAREVPFFSSRLAEERGGAPLSVTGGATRKEKEKEKVPNFPAFSFGSVGGQSEESDLFGGWKPPGGGTAAVGSSSFGGLGEGGVFKLPPSGTVPDGQSSSSSSSSSWDTGAGIFGGAGGRRETSQVGGSIFGASEAAQGGGAWGIFRPVSGLSESLPHSTSGERRRGGVRGRAGRGRGR